MSNDPLVVFLFFLTLLDVGGLVQIKPVVFPVPQRFVLERCQPLGRLFLEDAGCFSVCRHMPEAILYCVCTSP